MSKKTIAGIVGAIAVFVLLGLQSVEHWTVVDAVLTGLRNTGATGTFIADLLLSRIVTLVLAVAAIYLAYEGKSEKTKQKEETQSPPPPAGNNSIRDSGNATAKIENVHFHAHPPVATPPISVPTRPKAEPTIAQLTCIGATTANFHFGVVGYAIYECAKDQHSDGKALIVNFRNLGVSNVTAWRVRASLIFKDSRGREIGTGVRNPFWVSKSDRLDFKPDVTGNLVVLLRVGNELSTPYAEHVVVHGRDCITGGTFPFSEIPYSIEIKLRDARQNLVLDKPAVVLVGESIDKWELRA